MHQMNGLLQWLTFAAFFSCFLLIRKSTASQRSEPSTSHSDTMEIPQVPLVTRHEILRDVPGSASRIVNGSKAVVGAYPFMVALTQDIDGLLYVVCGAFLYDVYHVITAAHCVPNNITISSIYLSFGRWHLLSVEPWEQLKGVQQIIRHGSFNEETLENDIAILRLSDSVVFNTFVHPVCLPTTPAAEGEDGLIMGWGTTIDTGDSDYLQVATVPVLSISECTRDGWIDPVNIKRGMFCAGYAAGQIDTCQGDSGGPMVRSVNGSFEVIGIVSWGFGCALPRSPGVYQDVYYFLPWIQAMVGAQDYDQWSSYKCFSPPSKSSAKLLFISILFQIKNDGF